MAVVQKNKVKMHHMLNYWVLNEHVNAYTVHADICALKLREWWWVVSSVFVLDFQQAYLQIDVYDHCGAVKP